ncbi:MAG TPA: Ig-like domain-containing protein [Planctomycetota bacterium]|nr:Ig-like domain-containing protein [Planctomycetota bacterium]
MDLLRRCLVVSVAAVVIPACGGGGGGGGGGSGGNILVTGNQPPSVTLDKPSPGATFTTGTQVELEAQASDSDGSIQKVDFFDGSSRLATVVSSPFRIVVPAAVRGIHSLTARATDNLGATTVSVPVQFSVVDPGGLGGPLNQPPSVAISDPTAGTTFPPGVPITIEAQATDPEGPVVRVDFFDGSLQVGSSTQLPFKILWNDAAEGFHSLVAVATDIAGASGTSLPVSIFVATSVTGGVPSPPTPTWFPQGPLTPSMDLRSVFFTDASHGWIVAPQGVILASIDSGATWVSQPSGTFAFLEDLQFINGTTGWVVGGDGTILKTTSAGLNWIQLASRTSAFLTGVWFINANQGWVSGHGGTILTTGDGGATWSLQVSGTAEDLESIFFISSLRGWAVGTFGTILTTTDGGSTWTSQQIQFFSASGIPLVPSLNDVRFITERQGAAVGIARDGGVILTTQDGGATWVPHGPVQSGGAPASLRALSFGDARNAWAVGAFGTIWATSDGGATWLPQTSGTVNDLSGVSFINASTGWAVGTGSTVLKTTTGGHGTTVSSTSSVR